MDPLTNNYLLLHLKRKSEEELQLEEALRRSVADTHVSRGARRGSPDIRAAGGGDAFDALLCAEEGSGGLGSRTPSVDSGSGAPTLYEEAALQSVAIYWFLSHFLCCVCFGA